MPYFVLRITGAGRPRVAPAHRAQNLCAPEPPRARVGFVACNATFDCPSTEVLPGSTTLPLRAAQAHDPGAPWQQRHPFSSTPCGMRSKRTLRRRGTRRRDRLHAGRALRLPAAHGRLPPGVRGHRAHGAVGSRARDRRRRSLARSSTPRPNSGSGRSSTRSSRPSAGRRRRRVRATAERVNELVGQAAAAASASATTTTSGSSRNKIDGRPDLRVLRRTPRARGRARGRHLLGDRRRCRRSRAAALARCPGAGPAHQGRQGQRRHRHGPARAARARWSCPRRSWRPSRTRPLPGRATSTWRPSCRPPRTRCGSSSSTPTRATCSTASRSRSPGCRRTT